MKVLLAGYSKTGTNTIHAALEILGYEVYDFRENWWYLSDDWLKLIESGGTVDDLKKMYKDVDATVDAPVYTFWEEILQAFPNVKIILTTRDEDSWYKSLCSQYDSYEQNNLLRLMWKITPTGNKYYALLKAIHPVCLAGPLTGPFQPFPRNEMILKQKFRQHNTYVKMKAPKENFLEFDMKNGWKPLCEFLGKDIPNQPFPHENKGANLLEKFMKEHPIFQRMKKELFVSLSVIALMVGFGGYKLCKHLPWKRC